MLQSLSCKPKRKKKRPPQLALSRSLSPSPALSLCFSHSNSISWYACFGIHQHFYPSKCPFASHLAISLNQWNLLVAIKIYILSLLLVYSKKFFMGFPNKNVVEHLICPTWGEGRKKKKKETVQDSTLRSRLCGKYVTVRKEGLHGYLRKVIVVPLI